MPRRFPSSFRKRTTILMRRPTQKDVDDFYTFHSSKESVMPGISNVVPCKSREVSLEEHRDVYFKERPQIDTIDRRNVYSKGFNDAWAYRHHEVALLQARIDALMIHYCPEEMTEQQLQTYEASLRAVNVDLPPELQPKRNCNAT